MIYVLGDLHIRKEEPFFTAAKKVLEDLDSLMKDGDTLIQLGDLFHTSKPYPIEYSLFLEFYELWKIRGIQIILLAGNHDYNYNQKSYSVDPFQDVVVYSPTQYHIESSTFLFLPWEPVQNFRDLIETKYPEKFKSLIESSDFLVYHFPDETVMFGSDYQGIDLSIYEEINPRIKRLGGDIHKCSTNYLGTPYQTRYDEKGQIGRFAKISSSNIEYIEIAPYIEYIDIEYGKKIIPNLNVLEDGASLILTIKNAPSVEAAKEKYGDYFIRLIETTTSIDRVEAEEKELSSLKEALTDFLTINKVNKETRKYLQEVVNL